MDNVEEIRNQLFNFVGQIGITQHLVPHVDQLCRMVKDSQSQIATLTAERDETREELATLRSAPGMGEVDVLLYKYRDIIKTLGHVGNNADRYDLQDVAQEIADLARRAIASREEAITSREEVVGLLKWLKAVAESAGLEFRPGLNRKTDRILEIVEGNNEDLNALKMTAVGASEKGVK